MDISDVIIQETEPTSGFLDRLSAYDQSWNTDALLDNAREVWDSDNYYWLGVPFPVGPNIIFNKTGSPDVMQTYSADITVPAYALLTKISYFQSPLGGGEAPLNFGSRFKLRIYDKGGRVDMIHTQFALGGGVGGNMCGQLTGQPMGQNDIFGPYYLLEKKFVMPPGALNVEISDLSGIANVIIQVFMSFAVPLSRSSVGISLTEGKQS